MNTNELKTIIVYKYGEPVMVGFGEVKYGRKYVYVRFWMDEGGKLKLNENWDFWKYDPSEVKIFDGVRRDIEQKYLDWREKLRKWENAKREFQYKLKSELMYEELRRLDAWLKEHPRPTIRI